MIKMRPFLRYDGIYVCKMMYRRSGLSENSMNHPVHEVVSYRYLKFNKDRSVISLYTVMNPKRFLPKIKEILDVHTHDDDNNEEESKEGINFFNNH
jgi:hypothetical protein